MGTSTFQSGIMAPLPPHGRHLLFQLQHEGDAAAALDRLSDLPLDERTVIGLGPSLVAAVGGSVDGLREQPVHSGPQCAFPSTPTALWVWLRGNDRGDLLHRGRAFDKELAETCTLANVVDTFVHRDSRDLSGYVDGTENPTGDAATKAAFASACGPGLDGSSFVAVQQWVHDFAALERMTPQERDHVIGRRLSDNEEIADAPASAHVKRTAQEGFNPPAFLLRRSMPWTNGAQSGLVFVAFGRSFDAMDAQLAAMSGKSDGVVDALFRFTRPISGAYFWCPPLRDGRLDLSLCERR